MTGDESELYEPPDPEVLEAARQRAAAEKTRKMRELLAAARPYPSKNATEEST